MKETPWSSKKAQQHSLAQQQVLYEVVIKLTTTRVLSQFSEDIPCELHVDPFRLLFSPLS